MPGFDLFDEHDDQVQSEQPPFVMQERDAADPEPEPDFALTPDHPAYAAHDQTYVSHQWFATVATRILAKIREPRARPSGKLILALAAALVLLCSAVSGLLLWHPPQHPLRVVTASASAMSTTATPGVGGTTPPDVGQPAATAFPIYIQGQPTWTPLPYATSTPATKSNVPPTATATTGPPTATPDPHGGSATITISKASRTITVPSALTACDNCALSSAAATIPSLYVTSSIADVYGNYAGYPATTNKSGVVSLQYTCQTTGTSCHFFAGDIITPSQGSASCTLAWSNGFVVDTVAVDCTIQAGRQCVNYMQSFGYFAITGPGYACYGSSSTSYYVPSDCLAQGGNGFDVTNDAIYRTVSAVNATGLISTLAGPGYNVGSLHCSSLAGSWLAPDFAINGMYYAQLRYADAWRYSYDPRNVPPEKAGELAAAVPSGWVLVSSAIGNPSIGVVDFANHHAALTCSASAVITYNWGSTDSTNLAQSVVNLTAAQAQAVITATTGVGGSSSVVISGGKTLLPSNASNISIVVQ